MALVVLPAIRLSRVQQRLADMGLSYDQRSEVMQIIEDEIEVGARRIGCLCPVQGCRLLTKYTERPVGHNSMMISEVCSEHGAVQNYDRRGLPLVIAFDPISSYPQSTEVEPTTTRQGDAT